MISIITAIYNQLSMNRLFYESLCATTDSEFELIIIDNNSDDGSREFFESLPGRVQVIHNEHNYSYPHCQNQGIAMAQGDILAFLNNDESLSPHWDSRIMQLLSQPGYEILSLSSNDRTYDARSTKHSTRRWKLIKNLTIFPLGTKTWVLRLSRWLMYGNFNDWCERLWKKHGLELRPGFAGSAILMTRKGLELIHGGWDITQQAADFDLYMQSVELHKQGLLQSPLSIVCGIYHHHFSRLTLHSHHKPFYDADNLKTLEEKWGTYEVKQVIEQLKK